MSLKNINDELYITIANSKICPSWKSKINEDEFILGIITKGGVLKHKLNTNKWDEVRSVIIPEVEKEETKEEDAISLLRTIY